MSRGPSISPGVSIAGSGNPGYCKLCSLKDGAIQNQFDDRTRQMWSPKQLNTWMVTKIPNWQSVDRKTIYNHRDHVKHPQDRIVSAVRRSEERALQTVPKSSPDVFLDALVSLGHKRAIDNPDEVTIDHALRAASTLKSTKDTGKGGLNVLIALITGNAARPETIDGDYTEVQ